MTWGDIFNKYRRRGHDHADAAYRADQWEKRQRLDRWKECPITHCERGGVCRSPNDCSAKTQRS